ncbi:FAD:protein FMN transferase [Aliiroseovarius sp. F20344]|uniref:FAD:protein FMN transferase n=1 Tax=Aliiroseovarius sp. F20344 TaxID=2926414 RepID=UPI001FF358BC|nr:FAD:protein FMN transferase [Aliiroseovarius sp. F20344]MCK0140808.1 FAD:protein FMN transferase [Aliiroseovarius sp. F20344]
MMQRRNVLKIGAAALGAMAFARYTPSRREWRGRGFGADLSVVFHDGSEDHERIFSAIETEVERLEQVFSLFRPSSAISRLNRDGELHNPPKDLVALLEMSKRVWTATDGVFDPTVQSVWQDGHAQKGTIAGFDTVDVRSDLIRFEKPGTALTLNGIAQGYASDQLSRLLQHWGHAAHLVNLGEFAAGDGDWRIGIENSEAQRLTHTDLSNLGLATSAPGAMKRANGQTHIVHPFGKAPVWKTVTVQAQTSALADAYSTALSLVPHAKIETMDLAAMGITKVWLENPKGAVIQLG